jgi:diguanylate cyclase (GGDEF)-like protein
MKVINALVIDDEADARAFLVASLQSGGLTVAEATSAEEALGHLESFKPEIIVADVNLPAMSGYELCRRVREMGHDDIPFIFCSALGGLPERIRGLRTGGDAYLVKPVSTEELLLHVTLHLERTRRVRRLQASVTPLADALTGKLEDVSLIETLQLLDMRGRGEPWIGIDRADDHGEIFIAGRELVHASTKALTGHKALLRMLSWESGTFRMEDRSWLAGPTLTGRIDHVLFDATAEVDETRALRQKLPAEALTLAPVPGLFTRVLPEPTLEVLRLVEKHANVADILDQTEMADSAVLRLLLQLAEDGFLLAASAPPDTAHEAPPTPFPARAVGDPGAPPPAQAWDDMLRELRREYLAGAGERLTTLRDALAELDTDPASAPALQRALRAFHAFAGSGTTYGFPAVTARGMEGERRCVEVERAARAVRADELTALRRLLTEIDTALAGEVAPDLTPVPSSTAAEPRRIVVADPQPETIVDFVQGLRAEGMVVEQVDTVEAAESALERLTPDALVLDARLADGVRYDLVRRFRETACGQRAVVIVIGTPGEFLDKVEAIQAGTDAVLEKPLLRAAAVRTLKRLMDRSVAAPGRVLAVEDDREQASFYEKVLGAAGYVVRVCADPSRLEAELAEFAPDLVLMDVVLPGVDGFDLARFIRQDERYATLPVLFVTTQAQTRARVEAVRAGADDFLVKPLLAWLLLPAVAARIERGRLLKSLVDHDGLTRLPAHSAFLERAQGMLAQAIRERDRRVALVLVDVDGMRDINHRHGHLTGDRLLSSCAELLRRRLRPSDLVGRFGGDEFGCVLTDLDAPDAVRLVMRLRDEFAAITAPSGAGEEPVSTTFSAGIAMLNPSGMDLRRWVQSADDALRKARTSGVGRVRLAAVEIEATAT